MLADRQSAFGAALLDNRLPPPAGLVGPDGQPSPRRFSVYRNNVMVGLIDALADAFPTVLRLVGTGFFRAMAGVYARAELPASPVLLDYGAGFAAFLDAFPPLSTMPFIADVARIERAWVEAYHAPEAGPGDVAPLLAMAPRHLGAMRFDFHPSVRLVQSRHAAVSAWAMNQPGATPSALDLTQPEQALILRPVADVTLIRLESGMATFLDRLMQGASLAQASASAFVQTPRFDLAKALSALLLSGALIAWHPLRPER